MTARSEKTTADRPDPARLRDICWELGTSFPSRPCGTRVVLTASHPRLGYVSWSVEDAAIHGLKERLKARFDGARFVVRIYDVTDILFDGLNAHSFFDVGVEGLSGNYYVPIPQGDRNLLAEVGFVLPDQSFHALARSVPRWFDRDRPTNNFQLGGLFVSSAFRQVWPVETVLDAPVFERLHEELHRIAERAHNPTEAEAAAALSPAALSPAALSPAALSPSPAALSRAASGLDTAQAPPDTAVADHPTARSVPLRIAAVDAGLGAHLTGLVRRLGDRMGKLDADVTVFADGSEPGHPSDVVTEAQRRSAVLFAALDAAHRALPFHLIHCHEWYSVPAALRASRLGPPLILSIHSTEYERAGGAPTSVLSQAICDWEVRGCQAASLVIVPREATRQVLVERYGVPPDRVHIASDAEDVQTGMFPDAAEAKQGLGLDPSWPVVLFAGELSHSAGADLLMDAVETVCRDSPTVHFVFAGDGPLRGDLEARAVGMGLGHRCRFLGDVPGDRFEAVLLSADFLVIPARTWQDEGLAQLAISYGKPVLTTRQANLHCVDHGHNGLVTYDNPGSIVWGVKELLANPLRGNMLRLLARRRADHGPSLDRMAVEHWIVYERLLERQSEVVRG